MGHKVKFHISDILSGITMINMSLPEHPPIGEDGKPWPVRSSSMAGMLEIVEFTAGVDTTHRRNPTTGAKQFSETEFLDLLPMASRTLAAKFPELAKIDPPVFDQSKGDDDVMRQIRAWIAPLEKEHGSYFEVEAPDKLHFIAEEVKRDQERRGPPGAPSVN